MEILNDPKNVAIHEAGHAVIGRVLGLRCGATTIVADHETAGHSIIEDPMETFQEWENDFRKQVFEGGEPNYRNLSTAYIGSIIAKMAGAEAEVVIIGHCEGGDGNDRREISKMFDSGYTEIPPERWMRYEARMRHQTRRLIRRHRAKIEQIAEALLSRKTLQPEEIDEIVGMTGD